MSFRPRFLHVMTLLVFLWLALAGCTAANVAQPEAAAQPALSTAPVESVVNQTEDSLADVAAVDALSQAALAGTLTDIYTQVSPSVVHIQTESGEGSGFVWDTQGHIVTNNHVIEGAARIIVIFADDRQAAAEVVGTDPDSDLAVLKVDLPAEDLQPVRMGDSTTLQVGQLAIAIGNPFGQEGTMTVGIISALGRLLPVDESDPTAPRYNIPDVIQTDAAINPGNSGGVLLNDQGEVIGVTSAIVSPVRASSGIGFAIPAAIVQQVAPALIRDGFYNHPYLGISGADLTPELAEAMGLSADQRGALVIEVVDGGPADQAGLRGSTRQITVNGQAAIIGGDVITALDGRAVASMDDLIAYLSRYGQAGQNARLSVLRDGQNTTIDITLGARPTADRPITQLPTKPLPTVGRAYLGIIATSVTPSIAGALGLPADQTGVLVIEVEADGPADQAGVRGGNQTETIDGQSITLGGDIITALDGEPVGSMPDLQALLALARPGDGVTLELIRDGQELSLTVTLGERATP